VIRDRKRLRNDDQIKQAAQLYCSLHPKEQIPRRHRTLEKSLPGILLLAKQES